MLRWKKDPRETGLRSVGAGPYRRSTLHDGEKEYASVNPSGGDWRSPLRGWYWVSWRFGEIVNTCDKLSPDEATAKKAATEYVKAKLAASSISKASV